MTPPTSRGEVQLIVTVPISGVSMFAKIESGADGAANGVPRMDASPPNCDPNNVVTRT